VSHGNDVSEDLKSKELKLKFLIDVELLIGVEIYVDAINIG
jgi:hypothetical protein